MFYGTSSTTRPLMNPEISVKCRYERGSWFCSPFPMACLVSLEITPDPRVPVTPKTLSLVISKVVLLIHVHICETFVSVTNVTLLPGKTESSQKSPNMCTDVTLGYFLSSKI